MVSKLSFRQLLTVVSTGFSLGRPFLLIQGTSSDSLVPYQSVVKVEFVPGRSDFLIDRGGIVSILANSQC